MKAKGFLSTVLSVFLAVLTLFSFAGCGKPKYDEDEFYAYIKTEYKDNFISKEFTVEDFQSKYIKVIEYSVWNEGEEPKRLCITIQLKKYYKYKLEEVMKKVNNLYFVDCTEKIVYIYLDPVH